MKWKLTRIKKLSDDNCIMEFAVEGNDEFNYDFMIIGCFLIPNFVFDDLRSQSEPNGLIIQRDIIIEDGTA